MLLSLLLLLTQGVAGLACVRAFGLLFLMASKCMTRSRRSPLTMPTANTIADGAHGDEKHRAGSMKPLVRTVLALNGILSVLVFLNPTLDFCMLSTAWIIGVVAYWVGVWLALRRRSQFATTDYSYLIVGQVIRLFTCDYAFYVIAQYS